MKLKAASGITLNLLLIGVSILAFDIQPVKAEPTTWTVDDDGGADFSSIQESINAASSGDTIYVYNGTYYENVVVNKSVSVVGENKDATMIDGSEGSEDTAVEIIANNVVFKGFTTTVSAGPRSVHILLNRTANTVIDDNNICIHEIFTSGIQVYTSTNITLTGNNITGNGLGVYLFNSSYVFVAENNIASYTGIGLVNSSNNTVTCNNLTEIRGAGIFLIGSFNNTIAGNMVTGYTHHDEYWGRGIEMRGYSSGENSSYNTFYDNDIKNTGIAIAAGLYASGHHNNVFLRNNITNNYYGIYLQRSLNFTFKDNTFSKNIYNLKVYGFDLPHYIHNIDTSNTVDGKPVYYLINEENLAVNPSNFPSVGYLAIINSTNITVENLNLKNNGEGLLIVSTRNSRIINNDITKNGNGIKLDILSFNNTISENNITDQEWTGVRLDYSFNNTLLCNTILNNSIGVRLYGSFNNTLTRNTIANNSRGGIWLDYSFNNVLTSNDIINNSAKALSDAGVSLYLSYVNEIYHNNFINNQRQAYTCPGNIWDDGYPSGGNYWSNYTGVDVKSGPNQDQLGSDGIGDTAYAIDESNQDDYPLMNPWRPIAGDVNGDGIVDIGDITLCALAFGSRPRDSNWNPIADCNQDGLIDIFDLVTIGIHFGETL